MKVNSPEEMGHKEPTIVGFLMNAETKLQFFNQFSQYEHVRRVRDEQKVSVSCSYQEITGRLNPTTKESSVVRLWSKDCTHSFTAAGVAIFSPKVLWQAQKHDIIEPGLSKDKFRWSEMLCLFNQTYCCYDITTNKHKVSFKGLNNCVLRHSCEDLWKKIAAS